METGTGSGSLLLSNLENIVLHVWTESDKGLLKPKGMVPLVAHYTRCVPFFLI